MSLTKDEESDLIKKIELMRVQLNDLATKRGSVIDEDVILLSQQLDILINKWMVDLCYKHSNLMNIA